MNSYRVVFHGIVMLTTIAGFLSTVLLWRSPNKALPSNKWLGFSMLALTLALLSYLTAELHIIHFSVLRFTEGLMIFFMALSYLYTRNIVEVTSHAFVGKLQLVLPIFFFVDGLQQILGDVSALETLTTYRLLHTWAVLPASLYEMLTVGIIVFYWYLQVRLLWRFHRDDIRARKVQTKTWRDWMTGLLTFEGMIWLPLCLGEILGATSTATLMTEVCVSALMLYVLVTLLRKPEIGYGLTQSFGERSSLSEQALLATLRDHEVQAEESSRIQITNGELILERLDTLMEEDKPFLLKNYSIDNLSHELGLTVAQISTLLNKIIGLSFDDYMDQQRVFHCQELIRNGTKADLDFDRLHIACGFADKKALTKAFKRFTTTDPLTYFRSIAKNG
ncbi:MAG TPA: helix-turn-helix domain-containing protein [Chryseolinea sp.]|nr:helix-turn-helix domain-containing protein [Chryseolinea sp.]